MRGRADIEVLKNMGISPNREGRINDSAGKFGRDQLYQATGDGKRRMKRAEQTKAFPGQRDACRETQQVCLYYTKKLVMQHGSLSFLSLVAYTKFPGGVINWRWAR